MNLPTAIDGLTEILVEPDPATRTSLVMTWSDRVLNEESIIGNERLDEVLADLAYDMSFYEPDAVLRNEDWSYFGDDELVRRIQEALSKLQSG